MKKVNECYQATNPPTNSRCISPSDNHSFSFPDSCLQLTNPHHILHDAGELLLDTKDLLLNYNVFDSLKILTSRKRKQKTRLFMEIMGCRHNY